MLLQAPSPDHADYRLAVQKYQDMSSSHRSRGRGSGRHAASAGHTIRDIAQLPVSEICTAAHAGICTLSSLTYQIALLWQVCQDVCSGLSDLDCSCVPHIILYVR